MAGAAADDVVWVDVLPTLKDLMPSLRKQLVPAGKQAGQDFGKALADGVDQASGRLTAARKKEADAIGTVRVAEAKLKDLRDKGRASASQLVAAEESLARAKRTLDDRTDAVARSTRGLSEAQQKAAKGAKGLDDGLNRARRSGGLLSSTFGRLTGVLAGVGLGRMFVGFVQDAQESARISRLTEAAIKSTGGAANVTAKQVGNLSTAISNKTAVDDEAIQSGANLLLTFTNVRNEVGRGNDIFNQATQTATDMSAALGQDMKSSAMQLGKALNDPIKGVSALQRVGVSFTASQKEQIKTLVESGDTLGAQKVILSELGKEFGGAAQAAASPLDRLKVVAGNLGEEVGGALLPAVSRFADWTSDRLIPAAQQLWGWLGQKLAPVFKEITGGLKAFVAAWQYNDGEITSSGLPGFMERLGYYAHQTFDFFRTSVIPTLGSIAKWFGQNSWAIGVLVGAYAAWKVAVIANNAALKIQNAQMAIAQAGGLKSMIRGIPLVSAATKVWAGVQWLLNAAMRANPIGIVITALVALGAGLVLAWNKSETFRKIVTDVWKKVQDGARWMWENVLKPVFNGLKTAWAAVGSAIAWVWTNVIKRAWDAIRTAISFLWNSILKPIFTAYINGWKAVGAAVMWVWTNVIRPAWSAVQAAARFLWNNVLKPVFSAVRTGWEAVGKGIRWVYDNVIKPAFSLVRSAVGAVKGAFDTAVKGIKTAWDKIKGYAKAPINFVIGTVLNDGLFKAFNWVIKTLHLPDSWKLKDLPLLASGGPVPGYSPHKRADNIPLMGTAGEFMQPVDTVDYYGMDVMERLRRRQIPRDQLQHLAGGGPVVPTSASGQTWRALWEIIHNRFPYARKTSDYRPGDPGYHGRGQAIDIAGQVPYPSALGRAQMLAMNRWIAQTYGAGVTELIHTAPGAVNLYKGAPHTYNQATQMDHMNHVHWAEAMLDLLRKGGGTYSGGDFQASTLPFFDVFAKLKGGISAVGQMVSKFGQSTIGRVARSVPGQILDNIWGKIKGPVGAFWAGITDNGDAATISGGSSAIRKAVQGAASMPSWGWGEGAQWSALASLIQGESSWNPKAQNPSSSASGLFQFINSTWAAYKGSGVRATRAADASISEQTAAGLRYIKEVYGSPATAYRMWSSRAPHWYHAGGKVPRGLGPNVPAVLAPDERVWTAPQDDYFRRFVDVTQNAGRGERVTNINNHLYAAPGLPSIDQLQRMQRRAEVLAGAS